MGTRLSEGLLIQWRPEYAVGVAQIDAEHRRLFALVEDLRQAMRLGKGRDAVRRHSAELAGYASEHLAHEEELMRRMRYPAYQEHVREHDSLRLKTREIETRVAAGEITITIELVRFLADWLKQHVMQSDCRIGEYKRTQPPPTPATAA
jgi:hemerythrin